MVDAPAPILRAELAAGVGASGLELRAVRRLAGVSVAMAVGTGLLLVAAALAATGHVHDEHLGHFAAAQAALFVTSLAMAAVARSAASSTAVLGAGLVYQVGGAALISVCAFWGELLLQAVMVKLSWLAVWILVFPLLVPRRPTTSLLAALASAATAPAIHLAWRRHVGAPPLPLEVLAASFLPYFLCAGLSALPAAIVREATSTARAATQQVRRFGSYRLQERLGGGGMGEVWRAEHELLARPAALKLIRPERLGSEDRAELLVRFAREAKVTASLRSPNTVSVYDYGFTEDGSLYYVMELLDGLDLETLVALHGPVPPARAVHILRQVCGSLAEAHRAGLVHRDVKPANIYLCRLGVEVDVAKVIDFGLVANRAPSPGPTVDEDFLVGTPAYMPPEVARGQQPDARSDLYSLGCVAYWLLTGRLVFEAKTPAAVVLAHVRDEPAPPSIRTTQAIPFALSQLVMECLEKDPVRRPRNAEELSARLEDLEGTVGSWSRSQARDWWRDQKATGPALASPSDPALAWLRGQGPSETDTLARSLAVTPHPGALRLRSGREGTQAEARIEGGPT